MLDVAEEQLSHQPLIETRRRKRMEPAKPGFIAPWELRVGNLRVYYDVEKVSKVVVITAVGVKIRNRVWLEGKEHRE